MRDCKKWCNVIQKSTTPSPFFAKLTLNNGDIVELEGEGELTYPMVSQLYSSTLKSAEIGELCTSIGNQAFYNCNGLTLVTIPNSVTTIGNAVFSGCISLSSITIGNSVTSIGDGAFSGCTNLINITIPSSVINIGSGAFSGSNLTNITYNSTSENWNTIEIDGLYNYLSSTLEEIHCTDKNILIYTAKLTLEDNSIVKVKTGAVITASSVTPYKSTLVKAELGLQCKKVDYQAFTGCTKLFEVSISEGFDVVDTEAFSGCSSLTNVYFPNNIISGINGSAFENCTSLTTIHLPSNLQRINFFVFYNCTSLTNITIPDSVTSIEQEAFGSSGLTSITIPSSVSSIDNYAFRDCTNLTSITLLRVTPPPIYNSFDRTTCPIYVPAESVNAYKAQSGWSSYTSRIQAITN